jgi:uncharacterized membrane protein
MEAFSDGVFSIAATLLVLEIAVHPPGTAFELLGHEWPAYLGYAISFLTIGAAWIAHNAITDHPAKAPHANEPPGDTPTTLIRRAP